MPLQYYLIKKYSPKWTEVQSYHWTLGYHRQLLYLKLSLRHICLRILLISCNYGTVKRYGQLVEYGAI